MIAQEAPQNKLGRENPNPGAKEAQRIQDAHMEDARAQNFASRVVRSGFGAGYGLR